MFAIQALLLLVVYAYHSSAKSPIYDSDLSYDCTHDDKIIIYGSNKYGSIYAEGTLLGGLQTSMCNIRKETNDSLVVFTVSACNVSLPVNITVMKYQQETNNNMVIGGNKVTKYQLKCNNVRLGGVDISETANIKAEDKLDLTKVHQKEARLSMILLNKDNETLDSSSTVMIGEELRLIISANNGFIFLPRSCIATDGLTTEAHSKYLIRDGMTLDASLISNFSDYTAQSSYEMDASLFAFHFLKTNNVSIICNITVCKDDDSSCPFLTQYKSGRRKRSEPIVYHTEALEASFSVTDSYSTPVDRVYDFTTSTASTGPTSMIVLLILCAIYGLTWI